MKGKFHMHPHDSTSTLNFAVCGNCHKEFSYKTGRGKGLFCSRDCARKGQGHKNRITITCGYCQKPFEVPPHRNAANRGKYCSKSCYNASGRANGQTPQPIEQRFWTYVQKTDTCWLWIGSRDPNGYGRLNIGGRANGKPVLAHRISYELHYGAITGNQGVLHHCDNPQCVNPDHLFLGDQLANVRDMIQKGRNVYGERCIHAKLTEEQVREIRCRYEAGGISQYKLALDYSVSRGTICDIVRYKHWSHLA